MRRTPLATLALCAALALSAALALGGCGGGDPKPKFTDSPDPSPSASSSAATEPQPPEMPDAAKRHTIAGAKAFTKYYFEVADYAQATLDVAPLVALADDNCDTCDGGADGIKEVARKKGEIHGGDTTISGLDARSTRIANQGGWMTVHFRWKITAQRVDYPGTKPDRTYKAAGGKSYFILKPTSTGWLVFYWEIG